MKSRGIAQDLEAELAGKVSELDQLGRLLIDHMRGQRLMDLALNAIEIIDRNLFERTCDVRWWARDIAVVDCAAEDRGGCARLCQPAPRRDPRRLHHLSRSLDLQPRGARARRRPAAALRRPRSASTCRARAGSARQRRRASGDEYSVADIVRSAALGDHPVATYAAAVREGAATNGRVIGVLAAHFDWGPQSQLIVDNVRLTRKSASARA